MTNAQLTLVVRLAGGLTQAGAAAVSGGYLQFSRSNKRDRTNALLSISTVDASALIVTLGGRTLAPSAPSAPSPVAYRPGSESAEVDGYMIDCGEDN